MESDNECALSASQAPDPNESLRCQQTFNVTGERYETVCYTEYELECGDALLVRILQPFADLRFMKPGNTVLSSFPENATAVVRTSIDQTNQPVRL